MAVMDRRSYLKKTLAREGLSRSCIYLLIRTAGNDDLPAVCVGESDDFVKRYAASPFPIPFDSFVVFTNKDDSLNGSAQAMCCASGNSTLGTLAAHIR